jgi:hypothetical protein
MITMLWLLVSTVQFTVWTLVCVIGWHLASPWWLWTVAVGGIIVVGLRLPTRSAR